MANLPAPEIPEGHCSRFSSGDWAPHPEEKLRELAFLMRDSKAKRAARKRTLAMPPGYVISVSLSIPETIKTRAVSPTLAEAFLGCLMITDPSAGVGVGVGGGGLVNSGFTDVLRSLAGEVLEKLQIVQKKETMKNGQMSPPMPNDHILIEELELTARLGVPDTERAQPQRLTVSILLETKDGLRDLADDLARTVDYAAVCAELQRFVSNRQDKLLETLANDMAEHLLAGFALRRVELELRKFILPETRYVAVRIAREKR